MTRSFPAIYENGVLRPLKPLEGVPDLARLVVTVTSSDNGDPKAGIGPCIGSISDADAAEMTKLIEAEVEKVDKREW